MVPTLVGVATHEEEEEELLRWREDGVDTLRLRKELHGLNWRGLSLGATHEERENKTSGVHKPVGEDSLFSYW